MPEPETIIQRQLLADIEREWNALQTYLSRLTPAQLCEVRDSQGWSVKDHLIHLAYWERSALFFLQGKPRHVALGVPESLYLDGGFDQINAAIQQAHREMPLEEAQSLLEDIHRQMLEKIAKLSDADLKKPYRRYLPDEPGVGEGPPALNVIYSNTADHYAEHLAWIKALVESKK